MQKTIKWIDNLNKVVGIILAIMLGIMSILIIAQVFTRFVINYPLHWSEELARYLMLYVVFFGSSLALRNHSLIAIEFLAESISKNKRKVLKIIIILISIVFFIILLYQGIDMLGRVQVQKSAGLGISMAIPYAGIPIGAALMIINSIAVLFELILGTKEEDNHGPDLI